MDKPYTLYVSKNNDTQGPASNEPPPDPGTPVPYARPELISNKQVTIFRQSFSGRSLFIDLCSYRVARRTATVFLAVKKPILLFCYLLKGQRINLDLEEKGASALFGNQYTGMYLPPGKYRTRPDKGRHLVMNFGLTADFPLSFTKGCPILSQLARSLTPCDRSPQIIPHCRIDFSTKRVIARLQKIRGPGNLIELLLTGPVVELLMLYESRLQSRDFLDFKTTREKVYEVKEFIENNYTRPSCRVSQITGEFNATRKTLSREYKKEFGLSMKEHIIRLRMKLACDLLEQNYLIKEITTTVGYENPFSFSRMFKKYYGYSPEEKKSSRKFFCFI